MTQAPSTVTGMASAHDVGDDYAHLHFVISQMLAKQATMMLVQVTTVNNTGGLAPVGFVDCLPMVHQVDGAGVAVPHAPIHNLPYFRMQGGKNAVILDPAVGDTGIAVFASRDISKVKNTRKPGLPGSKRTHDMGDGVYIGGFVNGTPENYIQFDENGDIHLKPASKVYVVGDLDVTGTTTVGTDVVAAGVSLVNHLTTGVQTGEGISGKPQA